MREVQFQITGVIGTFLGRVVNENGHSGKPEIEVLSFKGDDGWEAVSSSWPILKDGDYILKDPV